MPHFLSPHFTLDEMVFSQTAAREGIDNAPPPQVIENLRRLCAVLEQVRATVGNLPVVVSSGYRSAALNKAVGGSATSAHMQGLAVDFTVPRFGSTLQVAQAIALSGLEFDQLIHEYGRWVHLGLPPAGVRGRAQALSIFKETGYLAGLHARPVLA
ncbi:MAG TPA: D-Ala-D-Ala carboxypeptidase family metallohydrolase [Ramlibacter sp.]|nr:D-Ala-D-Ala carboxypeptidase family metallohydrolase [Ramlibacter sp.]